MGSFWPRLVFTLMILGFDGEIFDEIIYFSCVKLMWRHGCKLTVSPYLLGEWHNQRRRKVLRKQSIGGPSNALSPQSFPTPLDTIGHGMHKFFTIICLASGIVMELHRHITGICELRMYHPCSVQYFYDFSKLLSQFLPTINSPSFVLHNMIDLCTTKAYM